MGAIHPESSPIKGKKTDNAVELLYKELTKIQSTQLPALSNFFPSGGKGLGGAGTVFPIHEPIEQLGTISVSPITLNLASARTHYIKMTIDTVTDLLINLRELASGKAIRFVLDITLNVDPIFGELTFDPPIDNIPDFPKTLGSRFLLEIQGSKEGADERFEVMNAGVGTGLVTGIIITPTLENTSPASSEDVDLKLFQHFIFQLDANIELTLINLPDTENLAEQFILEFIQDSVGNRTLSVTNSISPSVPALDGTAFSRTVIVGFVVSDIGANKRIDMYLVGSP